MTAIMITMAKRNLRDTPFSIDRLVVWAIAIIALTSVIIMGALSLMQIEIPRPVHTIAATCVGGLLAIMRVRGGDE